MLSKNEDLLCSDCFRNEGLILSAIKFGKSANSMCQNCGSKRGIKLNKNDLQQLGQNFFVKGTSYKTEYGHAPLIQCNDQRNESDDFNFSKDLKNDLDLLIKHSGLHFFYYGPRLWMIGQIAPLIELQDTDKRPKLISRIISEYPKKTLGKKDKFYRIRVNPEHPSMHESYDSPPKDKQGYGRFSMLETPILYGSQDIEVCIHECRVTAQDNLYVSTLVPNNKLKLIDLTHVLEEDENEFESLDITVQMLFAAEKHSYPITQEIGLKIKENGYDGIIYPSYFTSLKLGFSPFDTVGYGICMRRIPKIRDFLKHCKIPNIALFGNPIKEGKVKVKCINRVVLNRVSYEVNLGPVELE